MLRHPHYELIPLPSVRRQVPHLPKEATVSVTASPARGLAATLTLASGLRAAGFRVVPHLAARMIKDQAELIRILEQLSELSITSAFVVGGDGDQAGEFPDGLSLLQAMADTGHPFTEIGIPGYPEGHALIPDEPLLEALRTKAQYASYVTTQICFEPTAMTSWIAARRADGITLPVRVGVPGAVELAKLIGISVRIGVGASLRYLAKNPSLIGRLIRPGVFTPGTLLDGLTPLFNDPAMGIEGLHVFTFNQVEATETWRARYLEALIEG